MTKKEELLAKIKELAKRGESGEKENASALLKTLMQKYRLSEADLNEDKKDYCFFKFADDLDKRLVCQIMYMVTSDRNTYIDKRKRKNIGCICTISQRLEIESLHHFYSEWFKKDLETFYTAFIYKNNIFPSTVPSREAQSEEEVERVREIEKMMMGMSKHHPQHESETKRIGYTPKMIKD